MDTIFPYCKLLGDGQGEEEGRGRGGEPNQCVEVLSPPKQMGWGLQTTLKSTHSWLSVHAPVVKRRNCRESTTPPSGEEHFLTLAGPPFGEEHFSTLVDDTHP